MITVALSKGRLFKDFIRFAEEHELEHYSDALKDSNRDLFKIVNNVKFIFAKGKDVPVYVEDGIADLGVVGLDTITETEFNVLNVSQLPFGYCHLAVAGKSDLNSSQVKRVATSFPNLTRRYFNNKRQDVNLVYLNGSVELAPLLGLSDAIVDIVQTGTTLKENDLVEYETIMEIQARLIANKQSFYVKEKEVYQFMQDIGVI